MKKPKPHVSIVNTPSGYVYQFKGQTFAFAWAWKSLSVEWCKNLCLFVGYQDLNAWKTAHLQGKI